MIALSGLTGLGVAAAGALLLATAGAAMAAPGTVYVADASAGLNTGTVFSVEPGGGAASVLTDSALLDRPTGLAIDRRGDLILADGAGLYRVDRKTGALSTINTSTEPGDVVIGADRNYYVFDRQGPAIRRIDRSTGKVTTIAAGAWGAGGDGASCTEMTIFNVGLRPPIIYFTEGTEYVFRVNAATGELSEVVEDPILQGADGCALSADERYLYVAANSSSPQNNVVRVDLASGTATKVAGFDDVVAVSLFPNGDLLASDTDNDTLYRLGRLGSPVTTFSTDPGYAYPNNTAIEPAKCGGRFPSIVGTTRRDAFVGSRFKDVISTLGGRDRVKGLQRSDVICTGKGNDRLNLRDGARDRASCGRGRDSVVADRRDAVRDDCETVTRR